MPDGNHDFPLGSKVSIAALDNDPTPILAALRESEPVSYVSALDLYFVTRHEDVVAVLKDHDRFVVGTERSLVYDIFGTHMMTVEGAQHDRHKTPHRRFFLPGTIRTRLEPIIRSHAGDLVRQFCADGSAELRSGISSRLPILTMLSLFGLPIDEEKRFRALYDDLELAVSNFEWDPVTRENGKVAAREFHQLMQQYLDDLSEAEISRGETLLAALKSPEQAVRLTDEEIRHNAIIIFFGGISTVDALILNTLYSLALHPGAWAEVVTHRQLLPNAINETIRWLGPVQSATRHVVRGTTLRGVKLHAGDTVNCMLAAANRDPAVFDNSNVFDIHRHNANQHLGFATGSL